MINQYLPLTKEDRKEMLKAISVSSIDKLFSDAGVETKYDTGLGKPLSEYEVENYLSEISSLNSDNLTCFAGGGVYDHIIPSTVNHILGRTEFYTAYTPYQAELSQGTLQSIYEYQTLISHLTEMDVTNASMYDGSSALAEAVLLSLRVQSGKNRNKILLADSINPRWLQVVKTYTSGIEISIEILNHDDYGKLDIKDLKQKLDDKTASVFIQTPNLFGVIEEDIDKISELVHSENALLITSSNPISLGLLKPPGRYNADIFVAEGQPLGIPLSFGGPYLGIMSCKEKYLRRMPGRLSGATTDDKGNRGYVMTLQTREQHIRREKATSNICSNQALMALASTVYLSLLGPEGLKEVAFQCIAKTNYIIENIKKIPGYSFPFKGKVFNEFLLKTPVSSREIYNKGIESGVVPGIPLKSLKEAEDDLLLIALTEKRTRDEIDKLIEILKTFG
jgi:glycine dehydrogenase subunit 1